MKEKIQIVLTVAIGVIIGVGFCYGALTLCSTIYQDHENITTVVNLINQQAVAAQKQEAPQQSAPATK